MTARPASFASDEAAADALGSHATGPNDSSFGFALVGAYMGLWGVFLGVVAVLLVADALSISGRYSLRGLMLAAGGISIAHGLSACMFAASYGLILRRSWAAAFAAPVCAAGVGMIALVLIAGTGSSAERIAAGLNVVPLILALVYLRNSMRYGGRHRESAQSPLQTMELGSWDEDSNGRWLGWIFIALIAAIIGIGWFILI